MLFSLRNYSRETFHHYYSLGTPLNNLKSDGLIGSLSVFILLMEYILCQLQGGVYILSPILFTIYIDDLLFALEKGGAGCFWNLEAPLCWCCVLCR